MAQLRFKSRYACLKTCVPNKPTGLNHVMDRKEVLTDHDSQN